MRRNSPAFTDAELFGRDPKLLTRSSFFHPDDTAVSRKRRAKRTRDIVMSTFIVVVVLMLATMILVNSLPLVRTLVAA